MDEAIAEYRKLSSSNPTTPMPMSTSEMPFVITASWNGGSPNFVGPSYYSRISRWLTLSLGKTLQLKGEIEQAIAELRTAIRLKPNDHNAHQNLGVILQSQGRVRGGGRQFRSHPAQVQ